MFLDHLFFHLSIALYIFYHQGKCIFLVHLVSHSLFLPCILVELYHLQRFFIGIQKKFHIDKEHQFPDQTQEKKEEGLRG